MYLQDKMGGGGHGHEVDRKPVLIGSVVPYAAHWNVKMYTLDF
jgi:hypothetical protein